MVERIFDQPPKGKAMQTYLSELKKLHEMGVKYEIRGYRDDSRVDIIIRGEDV